MPGLMEFHIDCLLNDNGRILINHDIRVEFIDGEVLGES